MDTLIHADTLLMARQPRAFHHSQGIRMRFESAQDSSGRPCWFVRGVQKRMLLLRPWLEAYDYSAFLLQIHQRGNHANSDHKRAQSNPCNGKCLSKILVF